jgi:hypothetical protein
MTTTTTTAVRAQDFSSDTTDTTRDRWTIGKMRHLVAALDGTPVVITLDRHSGFAVIGAELLGCTEHPLKGAQVRVKSTFDNGETSLTDYRLAEVGDTIIPLDGRVGGRGAKWIALESYRAETSAAIAVAQREHGDTEGRSWGRWSATPGYANVAVSYTPSTGNPAFADRWGTRWYGVVSLSELAAEVSA